MFFLKIDQLPVFTSYLFVIGQFVLKVISYWLTANNRKLINFLSTQFFNLRKCIESIFEEHYNWNDSKKIFLKKISYQEKNSCYSPNLNFLVLRKYVYVRKKNNFLILRKITLF